MKNQFCAWIIIVMTIALTVVTTVPADTWFPAQGWKDRPNPLASSDARVGGELSIFGGQYPKSLNYYLDNNVLSAEIFGAMYETLLSIHPLTLEYEPGLAKKWSISDDKKTFTFVLDEKARWSDGTPITARDVKWTFDAIMAPENLTGPHKVSLQRFREPVIIDPHTIRFTARSVHWKNLGAAGGFHILPQKAFAEKNFNKINFEFPVVSGPYRPGTIKEGLYLTLERRPDWWHINAASVQGTGNFQTLKFKFFSERENAFEAFKKGMIDIFPVYTSRIWVSETDGRDFTRNRIIKQKIHNHKPVGFQGFAMNMRQPPFDDRRIRRAMTLLLDRRKMNQALMYNQYFLHRSYFEDLYDAEHPCPNPLIETDRQMASKLLSEAGWKVNPQSGFREKNGHRLSFRFLSNSATAEKFLAIYAEDLKDAGVELVIDKKDWAAWARDMDEFNYQMSWAAWGAGLFKDPESMWSSAEARRKGGSNITGFQHPVVDELIEQQKQIFDVHRRNTIFRKIDQLIYPQYPYILLWNINYTRLLYWNRFGMPKTVLSKYGDERSVYWYWWTDEDSVADLKDAETYDLMLPPKDTSIDFDSVFHATPRHPDSFPEQ
jgi:microcin C transport system substrate-binding protein